MYLRLNTKSLVDFNVLKTINTFYNDLDTSLPNIKIFLLVVIIITILEVFWFLLSNHFYPPIKLIYPLIIRVFIQALGISYFVIEPALKEYWSTEKILIHSTIAGVLMYGFANMTIKSYFTEDIELILIDSIWGLFETGIASLIGILIIKTDQASTSHWK